MSPRGIYERKPRVPNKFAVVKRTLADDSFRAVTAGCKFVVEKGIPVPDKGNSRIKGESKYPFRFMNVGDSFLAKEGDVSVKKDAVYNSAKSFVNSGNESKKFTVRETAEGVRCWRVA
jgi:hypothetical protein